MQEIAREGQAAPGSVCVQERNFEETKTGGEPGALLTERV